jgi:hypothetical protein
MRAAAIAGRERNVAILHSATDLTWGAWEQLAL